MFVECSYALLALLALVARAISNRHCKDEFLVYTKYFSFYYTDDDGVVYNFNYMEGGVPKSVDLELLYNLAIQGVPIVLTAE